MHVKPEDVKMPLVPYNTNIFSTSSRRLQDDGYESKRDSDLEVSSVLKLSTLVMLDPRTIWGIIPNCPDHAYIYSVIPSNSYCGDGNIHI